MNERTEIVILTSCVKCEGMSIGKGGACELRHQTVTTNSASAGGISSC